MPKRELKALTNTRIRSLGPKAKDYEVFDSNVGGLSVRVFPSGKKSFSVNFRVNGKRKRIRISNPKDMGIIEARQIAIELKGRAKRVTNPIIEKCTAISGKQKIENRADQTIANLANEFIEKYCIGEKSKPSLKSWREYQRVLNKYVIPQWGNLHIETISIGALTKLLDTIAQTNGPYQANRVLAITRKLFNWSRGRGIIDYIPIVPNRENKESARIRFLNNDEIILFWNGCEKEGYPFGKLYQLLLVTGQRLGDVANMRWSQFDMAYKSSGQLYKVWKLPPHSVKMDKFHLVPLSPMTVKLINSIPRIKDNDLLFPSGSSNHRTVSGFGKSKKRICTFETDWRLNDLRRTVFKNLSRLEIDYVICKKVFGHVDNSVEGQFDLQDYLKQKQNALDKWSELLTSIL